MENQCQKCKHTELDHYELVPRPFDHPKAIVGVCARESCDCDNFESEADGASGVKKAISRSESMIDEKTPSPIQAAARRLLREQIMQIIGEYSPREQKILKLRYGLEDGVTHTLEEVGTEFGVPCEYIRQIEAKILEKIREHELLTKLEEY